MANTKLTRTMSTQGSSIKGTFSVWLKKSNLTGGEYDVYQHNYNSNYRFMIRFDSADRLAIGDYRAGWTMEYCTNRSFRDVNGWFHIYIAIDRTNCYFGKSKVNIFMINCRSIEIHFYKKLKKT